MTANKRIFWNVVATYGRSLIALGCGLFSSRWILQALGHTDFGLYSVVASIIVFITFFNGIFSASVSRYYAYAVGEGKVVGEQEAQDLQCGWFNSALSLHLFLPLILILIGYPVGVYAIGHWINVPADRVEACVVVYRLSLFTAWVSMVSVPFIAFYTAHQYIIELCVWSLLSTFLRCWMAYNLISIGSDRFIAYASFMTVIHVGISALQVLVAFFRFKACRIRLHYWFSKKRLAQLASFAGWQFFGNCGALMRNQACSILTNIYCGPKVNAAYGISNQVLSQAGSLTAALVGAFTPAITTCEGAGQRAQMVEYSWRASRIGSFLLLIFSIPLMCEIDEVLNLWLVNPPRYSSILCEIAFLDVLLAKMTVGQQLAVAAQGKIARYQATVGGLFILALPIAWLLSICGVGPLSAGLSFVLTTFMASLARVYLGSIQLGMLAREWLRKIVIPLTVFVIIGFSVGLIPRFFLKESFMRLIVTSILTTISSFVFGWQFILNHEERAIILSRIRKLR